MLSWSWDPSYGDAYFIEIVGVVLVSSVVLLVISVVRVIKRRFTRHSSCDRI